MLDVEPSSQAIEDLLMCTALEVESIIILHSTDGRIAENVFNN